MMSLSISMSESGDYMVLSVDKRYPVVADKTESGWRIAGGGMIDGQTVFATIEDMAVAMRKIHEVAS